MTPEEPTLASETPEPMEATAAAEPAVPSFAELMAAAPEPEPAPAPESVTPEPEAPAAEPTAEPAAASKPKRAKKEKSAEPEAAAEAAPAAVPAPEADNKKKWYVVKVASGQEDSIKARLERKIKVESLEQYIAQIVIPVERVTEIKKTTKKNEDGEKVTKEKRVIKERKKYPGYLMAEVEFNDQVLYLFRETPGVGDFVGGGPGKPPAPMTDYEVQRMLGNEVSMKDGGPQKTKPKLKVKIDLERGDKVRLRDGAFAGTEGEVLEIAEAKDDDTPKITVKVQFWGRDVKIDNLEFWQVDKV
jgi:transcriptional antiterminator NusG